MDLVPLADQSDPFDLDGNRRVSQSIKRAAQVGKVRAKLSLDVVWDEPERCSALERSHLDQIAVSIALLGLVILPDDHLHAAYARALEQP